MYIAVELNLGVETFDFVLHGGDSLFGLRDQVAIRLLEALQLLAQTGRLLARHTKLVGALRAHAFQLLLQLLDSRFASKSSCRITCYTSSYSTLILVHKLI